MKIFSSIKKMIIIETPKKKAGRISSCILIAVLIFIAFPAWSANYYIAQSAAGSGNASSCANAKAYTWDWTTGASVADGDTVYVCGTITGSADYNSYGLTIPKGGASTPITLKFCKDGEANCGTGNQGKFSSKYWSLYGAIHADYKNYITIDGNGVGIVENTNNGDLLTYHNANAHGVYIIGGSNIEVKNLIIQNLYVKKYLDAGDYSVSETGIISLNGNNISIHDNTINNAATGINYQWTSAGNYSNVNIYNNTISDCNWGIAFPGGAGKSTTTLTGISIYNNDISIGAQWTSPTDVYHHNGIFAWADQGNPATMTNVSIYNNYIHGPSVLPDRYNVAAANLGTGFIFIQYAYVSGLKIYNNLMAGITDDIGNGNIYLEYIRLSDVLIANNTMAGLGNASRCIGIVPYTNVTAIVKNNICYGAAVGIWADNTIGGSVALTIDNNDYYGLTTIGSTPTNYNTLAAWQTRLGGGCTGTPPNATPTGRECNSLTSNPDLSAVYTKKSTSPTKDKGASMSAYFTTDKAGISRPRGYGWDIGAYEYDRSEPPVNLRINVQ
jgi:hypothetical protein